MSDTKPEQKFYYTAIGTMTKRVGNSSVEGVHIGQMQELYTDEEKFKEAMAKMPTNFFGHPVTWNPIKFAMAKG